jgi:6-phosphogluconolactonase/glucosamine-6-phosphate isomerase/deaminase
MTKLSIIKYPLKDVWNKASENLIRIIYKQINQGERVLVLLSGGSAVKIYNQLVIDIHKSENRNQKTKRLLAFAQVDERFQPRIKNQESRIKNIKFNCDDINSEIIGNMGLWKKCDELGIPYYLVSQEGTLENSAYQYNVIIKNLFQEYNYKIGVFGIGMDGHTAGLLPGYSQLWNQESRIKKGDNKYVIGYENKGKFPLRISITPHAITQLDHAMVIAVGEDKKEIISNFKLSRNSVIHDSVIPNLSGTESGQIKNYKLGSDIKLVDLDKFPALVLTMAKKIEIFTDN